MVLCGIAITGFTVSVVCDIVTRTIGHPWLWLQEVTMTFFIYGVFIGTAVATRRNDHLYLAALAKSFTGAKRLAFETFNRLVVLMVALCMCYFGYLNFLDGFHSLRMPSMTPLASLYAAIPISGALIVLFTVEQLVNGWRQGFAEPAGVPGCGACRPREPALVTTNGLLIFLMGFLFLFLGYLGVPVAFALIAAVLTVTAFTPVSIPSMMAQLFNGIDTEALACSSVLSSGRRADDIRECHHTDDQSLAGPDRAYARRAGAGRHLVQHLFRWHFRLVRSRRRGAHAHARPGDETRGL